MTSVVKKGKREVVITAGGTGGHLLPALALAQALQKEGVAIHLIGKANPTFVAEFQKAGFIFRQIPTIQWPHSPKGILFFPFHSFEAILYSLTLFLRHRPATVVGMGGYATVAPATAAAILRIPLFLCEQNLLPGKTTRLFSRMAKAVFTSFPESSRMLKAKRVLPYGNPLRTMPRVEKTAARRYLRLEEERFTILVIGGSQGASQVNQKVVESLSYLSPQEFQFIHLTGKNDYSLVTDAYQKKGFRSYTRPFLTEMEQAYAAADLAVCRAGATTIAELAFFGLPALLVPYPFAAENHQYHNALALVQREAAELLEEKRLSGKILADKIQAIAGDRTKIARMSQAMKDFAHPAAADRIAKYIVESVQPCG